MKKKFIQKSDLEDILGHLSERALKNADKVDLEICFHKFNGEQIMVIGLTDMEFNRLSKEDYTIIDDLCDDMVVSEEIFDRGLEALDEREREKTRQNEESNN